MGNLKNGTKIKSHDEYEYEYIFKDETFWDIGNTEMLVSDLMGYNFEILSEEDEEIEINDITKIYINDIKSVGESENKCWTGRSLDIVFANKINELIKAVKKLDNLHRPVNAVVVGKESENR